MTVLYLNPCYEVCYKGTGLYVLITGLLQVKQIKKIGGGGGGV